MGCHLRLQRGKLQAVVAEGLGSRADLSPNCLAHRGHITLLLKGSIYKRGRPHFINWIESAPCGAAYLAYKKCSGNVGGVTIIIIKQEEDSDTPIAFTIMEVVGDLDRTPFQRSDSLKNEQEVKK